MKNNLKRKKEELGKNGYRNLPVREEKDGSIEVRLINNIVYTVTRINK